MRETLRTYYSLTKPGIIYGNAITAAGGFFLASRGQIDFSLFLAMLAGISLVVASGCVFNNYFDRDIDAEMERTKNRAFVKSAVSVPGALMFGATLGVCGIVVLAFHTNVLAAEVTFSGFIVYVALYTPLKRHTMHAALVGAVAGAVPPVVGYIAASNTFDLGALMLLIILCTWQMPHFDAIALYRQREYERASVPVLARTIGIRGTRAHMVTYIVLFAVATAMLTFLGLTKYTYLAVMLGVSLWWLSRALRSSHDVESWARGVFRFSLVVILVFSIMISLTHWLP